MITKQTGLEEVWDIAASLVPDTRLTVRYHSSRSDKMQSMSGTVESVHFEGRELVVQFRRDDGQTLKLVDNGWLLSVGSNFPRTGKVAEVDVSKPGEILPTTYWL